MSSRPVLVLQHAQSETLGTFEDLLRTSSKPFEYIRTFADQPVPPAPDGYSALIVMGGPMGVYETDRYPFLVQEMRLIEGFMKAKLPVLGVCLGSQLLAACLKENVKKGRQKEIGWYPVEVSADAAGDPLWQNVPSRFAAYHWHGDMFELPRGTTLLASSEITPVQAYRYDDRVYGILFHLEVSENHIRQMLSEFTDEIKQEKLSAAKIMEQTEQHLKPLQRIGATVFNGWAQLIESS